jgi:hypothetical protein
MRIVRYLLATKVSLIRTGSYTDLDAAFYLTMDLAIELFEFIFLFECFPMQRCGSGFVVFLGLTDPYQNVTDPQHWF